MLAYRPFLDPIELHDFWWVLIVPLAFLISVVYKAVRVGDLTRYWRHVFMMTVQTVAAMVGLGAACFLFVQYVLPRITG